MGDDRFLEPLIPRLQDADSNVRKEAVRAMGKLGNGEALPHLLSTANDSASDVRLAVATALGEIGDEKAKSTLATLANDDDVYVSLCSIKALGSLGAVEELVPVLRHEDQHVRGNAARILGELGDPKALEPLRGALKDEYDDVRVEASVAIRKIEENQEQISGHQKRP
jgi:vesicle coat complex subunit